MKFKTLPLSELAEIGDGNHSSNYPKASEMVKKGVPFLRSGNIQNGKIVDKKLKFISLKKHEILKKGHVKTGDILFTNRGEIGKIGIIDERFNNSNLNSQVAWIRVNSQIYNRYLYYYLSSPTVKFLLSKNTTGSALQQITIKQLKSLSISFPIFSEQKRIVVKLDASFTEIDKIINLTKERIIKEKDLNLSALKSIFSTIKSKKTIGEIATVIAGQSPEGKYYNRDAKGVPFYQGKKEFGDYELKKPTFWTTKTTKEALKGDVLLSVRAPVGETNMNNDKICIGRGLAAIRANKDNNSEFIYYFLNSIKKLIVGNTGAVFNSINKKQIEDIVIPIQSLDEQNKTINKIKLILSHIKKINLFTKQKLHNLNILKLSILNKELIKAA